MRVEIDGKLYVPHSYPKICEFQGRPVHVNTILFDKTQEWWNIPVAYVAFRKTGIVFVSTDGRELPFEKAKFRDQD